MSYYLDLQTWKRKDHYLLFSKMDNPFFNICANLDITIFHNHIKTINAPFFISFLYIASKAANEVEEFKLRIRKEGIFLHDKVHPSFTVMGEDDMFSFCYSDFSSNFPEFAADAKRAIEKVKIKGSLNDDENRDDYLYITSIPWITFTSVSHPFSTNKMDSVPRISWGKFEDKDGRKSIPISVSLHHGLADGFHVAMYLKHMQEYLDHPHEYIT